MGRHHIGVAIGLPEPFAEQLRSWRAAFGDAGAHAIPPHVTLLPPTAVPAQSLNEVQEHLHSVAAASDPFEIHLRGSATFRPVSPVVFVPLVAGIAPCERLEAQVRSGPLHREVTFPYHPHVTVAQDVEEVALDRAFDQLAGYEARFPVGLFTLFERDRAGVWLPLRDFPFAA